MIELNNKVVRMPNNNWTDRKRNQVGKGFVPCEVSGRYLNIHDEEKGEYLIVDVMTSATKDGEDRKLTELVIRLKDLKKVLNQLNEN